jgi:hypothetical protein
MSVSCHVPTPASSCLGIDHGPPVTYQYALLNIPQTSISAE